MLHEVQARVKNFTTPGGEITTANMRATTSIFWRNQNSDRRNWWKGQSRENENEIVVAKKKQRMDSTSAAGINPEPARNSKLEKASKPGAWAAE